MTYYLLIEFNLITLNRNQFYIDILLDTMNFKFMSHKSLFFNFTNRIIIFNSEFIIVSIMNVDKRKTEAFKT